MREPQRLISVAGTMGVGKSTVSEVLARGLNYRLVPENFQANPYLDDFYRDMHTWALRSQLFFLQEKAKQVRSISGRVTRGSHILDTPIHQDVFSYARAHRELGNMSETDWQLYLSFFLLLSDSLPLPNLIVSLTAPLPVLMERIAKRGRASEQQIPESYLKLLGDLNSYWLKETSIPVLEVDTSDKDFVHDTAAQQWLIASVRSLL